MVFQGPVVVATDAPSIGSENIMPKNLPVFREPRKSIGRGLAIRHETVTETTVSGWFYSILFMACN